MKRESLEGTHPCIAFMLILNYILEYYIPPNLHLSPIFGG